MWMEPPGGRGGEACRVGAGGLCELTPLLGPSARVLLHRMLP
jgi:hypothetical protein